MQCILSNRFIRDYRRLDLQTQEKVDEAIKALAGDRFYSGLKTRKLQGVAKPWANKVWEARVDGAFRITYHIETDALVLRRCGSHQIYGRP